MELLIYSEDPPRHSILTAFVKYLTGFRITDATDLESEEGPIPQGVVEAMNRYGPLIEEERLFHVKSRFVPSSKPDGLIAHFSRSSIGTSTC
jgi:hypothetical protein